MPTFTLTLGAEPVAVVAPEPGGFDPMAFRAGFPAGGLYGLDVETTYMDDLAQFGPEFRVRLVQFATVDTAWVLRIDDDEAHRAAAVELLSDPSVSFCSHSSMDVLAVATQLGVDITGRNLDTLMLAAMVDSDQTADRNLKTLATQHLGPELAAAGEELYGEFLAVWDGTRNAKRSLVEANGWAAIPADNPAYLRYAGLDAVACRRLAPILAAATGAPPNLLRVETWLASQANRIQLRGMRVDRDRLAALREEATRETGEAKAAILAVTGGVGPQSRRLLHWLGDHGVDWSAWTGALTNTGSPSLAKANAQLLLDYPLDAAGGRVVEELVRFKAHLDSLNKANGIHNHLGPDGRLHPSLHTIGAVTARMSSSGPNFQNFSKRDPRHRGLLLPDDGHALVAIDFDQVELRVVAALAHEEKMIDVILAGGDLHQLTADEIAAAGIEIDRDTAKMTNFLMVYGGAGPALHEQAGIPEDVAYSIVATWRRRYPAITELAAELRNQTDCVRTISDRRIPVTTNTKTGDLRTHANINYAVQSAARDVLVDAWLRFALEFGHADKVWFPIHDELVLQVPECLVDQVVADAEACMRLDFMGVPISASAVVLRDETGRSRWMTGKRAKQIRSSLASSDPDIATRHGLMVVSYRGSALRARENSSPPSLS